MALTAGFRLGPYEIVSLIGVGGMGEVYRARDTRLKRDVAIKVLSDRSIADSERRARFDRESRVLASLNHPHIGAIYGFEDSEGIRALVLELVEGPTLADRIARGPVPPVEAVEIARQIADALDAAHERGIVHRDLKPANVKITPDGRVKVLDFGLAKADDAGVSDLTNSPTITGHTRGGVLLGTAPYMSPEQARSNFVDKRTDIWAFGCVLYEMLTGASPFRGDTLSHTIVAILEQEPDWTALPAATPAAARRLIERCLAKDAKRRLRDIGDAKLELDASTREKPVGVSDAAERRRVAPWAFAGTAIVLASLIVAGLARMKSTTERPGLAIGAMTRLTLDSGFTTAPSISADGRLIAYASDRAGEGNLDIWVQQTSGGRAIRLTNDPANDDDPDVSPDGSLIAFRSDRNPSGVYIMPALGGDARLIAPNGRGPRFSHDGRAIAYWTGGALAVRALNGIRKAFVVPTAGGESVEIGSGLANAGDPVWSPDDRALLVFGHRERAAGALDTDWWLVSSDGHGLPAATGVLDLLRQNANAIEITDVQIVPFPRQWIDAGIVFSAGNSRDTRHVWMVGIDARTGRATGRLDRLTAGTTIDSSPTISRDGRLVFAAVTSPELIFGVPLDANAGKTNGPIRHVRDEVAETGRASASQDGRVIVFPRYQFSEGGVWIRDVATGRERQLAVTPRTPLNPVISPDGVKVAYTVTTRDTGGTSGPGGGFIIDAAGGAPRKVCDDCEIYHWTRDHQRVLVLDGGRRTASVVEVSSGRTTAILSSGEAIQRPFFAPDDRWITFDSKRRLRLAPFRRDEASPERDWKTLIELTGQERGAGWSPDGKLLYVLLERDGFRCLYALRIDPATGHAEGEPFAVQHFHDARRRWGSTGYGSAVVDGLFLADLFESNGDIWMATLHAGR